MREGLGDGTLSPWDEKRRMAREVVDLYHGPGAGAEAQTRFDRVHHDRELPESVQEQPIPTDALRDGSVYLPKLMAALGLARSNSQARGLIRQSGVRLDGAVVTEEELPEAQVRGRVLQVGRREFVRLR